MRLQINGQPVQVVAAQTVAELVQELGFAAKPVLVEYNGTALLAQEHQQPLCEGDVLELVQIVAGG